ncbi:predicted protein, partial [Nematostella vectensis]
EEISGQMFITDPSTGHISCEVKGSGKTEVKRAVLSARKAFKTWSVLSGSERGRILGDASRLVRKRREDIAKVEVHDNGIKLLRINPLIDLTRVRVDRYGSFRGAQSKDRFRRSGGGGWILCIGAWNYPIQTACWKIAPAIACGNTIVYKPSPLTPMNAVALADILTEAGVPPGVVNIIQGGGETGEMLSKDPNVAKVSFTGSVSTGQK